MRHSRSTSPNWETSPRRLVELVVADGAPWRWPLVEYVGLDPETGELVEGCAMLTMNADRHPLMRRIPQPDRRRTRRAGQRSVVASNRTTLIAHSGRHRGRARTDSIDSGRCIRCRPGSRIRSRERWGSHDPSRTWRSPDHGRVARFRTLSCSERPVLGVAFRQYAVESRCGAVALGLACLFPSLSFDGALVALP